MIEEGYEALNYKKNSEIYSQLGLLDELRQELLGKVDQKKSKIEAQLSMIDQTKQSVFAKIDSFFNRIIEIAEHRKEKLKTEYLTIEEKERASFATSLDKIRQDSADLTQISQAFNFFYQGFDDAEDFNKNTENMYFYQASYQQVQKQLERKANFYKLKKFQPSEFKCIESDLLAVSNMGKIMDNSLADAPLVLFDSQKFAAFEYQSKGNTFQELPLIDTENFAERIPKDFKSIYVGGPEQSFLLVGGFDIRKETTSNAAYLYQKGKLKEVLEMYLPRQFFGICSNLMTELAGSQSLSQSSTHQGSEYINQTSQSFIKQDTLKANDNSKQISLPKKDVIVYVIGGFNDTQGSLKSVESFNMETRQWRQHSSMNVERINPGCCTFDKQYVYVFGGRSADARADFYDSIEKFNTDLNLWSFFKIRLPEKLCNMYAFTVKNDYIMVLGGLKRIKIDSRTGQVIDQNYNKPVKQKYIKCEQQVDSNVYLYSQTKQVWFNLKPLSKQMKVCNVIPSGDARFNCFLLQKPNVDNGSAGKRQEMASYPLNVVYDLKVVCPRLDRYWYFDHMQKAKSRQIQREPESSNFLKSVSRDQNPKSHFTNQSTTNGSAPQSSQPQTNSESNNGLQTKNFEWERRQSNFNPAEFGLELQTMADLIHTTTEQEQFTYDSMPTSNDFDKAVESGVIDSATAMQERQQQIKLSKAMQNFARVSLHLGRSQDISKNLGDGPQASNPNQAFFNTREGIESEGQPTFGQSLDQLAQSKGTYNNAINNDGIHSDENSESDEDLVSAFK